MPKFLGREITQQQANQLRNMANRWRSESSAFLKEMEKALTERFRRNPDVLANALERLQAEIQAMVGQMEEYKKAVKSSGDLDKMMRTAKAAESSVGDGRAAAAMYAAGDLSASQAAESLQGIYADLVAYSKAVENFNVTRALTNMLSDSLAEREQPGARLSVIDFAKSLQAAHKEGEYRLLVAKLPKAANVRTWTLLRFPVVPIMGVRRKSDDFTGFIDVDPIVFQDQQGRVRSRYLVFRNQLVMAVNKQWLDVKITNNNERVDGKRLDLQSAKGVGEFIQAEMDEVARAASLVPGTSGAPRRERLLGNVLVTYDSASHKRAPGLQFFWFMPRRDANLLRGKIRAVRDWTLALP